MPSVQELLNFKYKEVNCNTSKMGWRQKTFPENCSLSVQILLLFCFVFFCFAFLCFVVSQYVAEAGLEFTSILHLPTECLVYRLPCLTKNILKLLSYLASPHLLEKRPFVTSLYNKLKINFVNILSLYFNLVIWMHGKYNCNAIV